MVGNNDDVIKLQITIDEKSQTKAFDGFEKEAEKSGKAASSGMSDLFTVFAEETAAAFAMVGAAAVAAFAVAKQAFDFTLEAEKAQQIGRSFDAMAESAGLVGESLKEGLLAASNGLADDTSLLQAANRAIIQLGENASVLPQTMELARKATALFGGSLVANFEAFNEALASGNAKALKQFGIVVDSDAAVRRYAESLGVSVNVLTEAGRRQAIMNEALAAAETKLGNVDESALAATNSLDQLKVSFSALYETTARATQNSGFFQASMDILKDAVDGAALYIRDHFGSAVDQTSGKLRSAQGDISAYTEEIKILQEKLANSAGLDRSGLLYSLDVARGRLAQARTEFAALNKQMDDMAGKGPSGKFVRLDAANPAPMNSAPKVDQKLLEQQRIQAEQQFLAINRAKVAADEALIQQEIDTNQRRSDIDSLNNMKRILVEQDFDLQIRSLRAANEQSHLYSKAQLDAAEILLEQQKQAQIAAIQDSAAKENAERLKQMSDAINNTFRNVAVGAIQAFGAALVKGGAAFSEFGKSMLSMIGDLATLVGTLFLFTGNGINAMFAINGPAAIAAGIGLIALGGLLKAFASAGSDSGGGVASTASGGAESNTTTQPLTEEQKKTTEVHVNIQGNVFDRRETGMAITEALSEYFNANDGRLTVIR